MKKLVLFLVAVVLLASASSAFAITSDNFENFYTVGSDSSTVQKNVFGWDETPWLYYELPTVGYNVDLVFWYAPDNQLKVTSYGATLGTENWVSPDNWASIRQTGDWTVWGRVMQDGDSDTIVYDQTTSFTVTPEPISALLFVLGGGLLGFRLKRKSAKV